MPLPTEAQLDAGMDETFPLHPFAHANLGQEIDGSLFENTGADGGFDLFARACFQHDGRDAFKMQKMRQQQTCRSGSDDADLSTHTVSSMMFLFTTGRLRLVSAAAPEIGGRILC